MSAAPKQVVLTADLRYADALALLRAAWPRLSIILYTPTVEHYKEGYPTAEELEHGPDDPLGRTPGREAVLHGDMKGQDLHHAVLTSFGLETGLRGGGIRSIWRETLDAADARLGP